MPKVAKDNPKVRPIKQFVLATAIVLIAFVVVMNIMSSHLNPLSSSSSTLSAKRDLEITISTDKTSYKRNESMFLQLSVTNRTDKAVVLNFPSSLQYNFIVKREFDFMFFKSYLDIWQSSFAKPADNKPSTLSIQPKHTKIFKEIWKLEDASRKPVLPGRYVILGVLPATGGYMTELQLRTKTTK